VDSRSAVGDAGNGARHRLLLSRCPTPLFPETVLRAAVFSRFVPPFLLQSPVGQHRIFAPLESLHSPHLLEVEVAQVLRRYVRDIRPTKFSFLVDLADKLHRLSQP
jgi:hypothetical protein